MPTRAPKALIIHAPGTNRDADVARALGQLGARPRVVLSTELYSGQIDVQDFDLVVLPGGFTYGDDLGAGRVWGAELRVRLGDALDAYCKSGRPLLGICNGFQALLAAGLLAAPPRRTSLSANQSGHFECRWTLLKVNEACTCVFTQHVPASTALWCPVAHAEGRVVGDFEAKQVPLFYNGPAHNPNGSRHHAAALCNRDGNVMGLMPHPENATLWAKAPAAPLGQPVKLGFELLRNGVRHAMQVAS